MVERRSVMPLSAGDAAACIERVDWRSTPLGPEAGWPAELRVLARTILASPVPMAILWGEGGVLIYNDGYAQVCGPRHPEAMGRGVLDVWPEAHAFNAHVIAEGRAGRPLRFECQELELWRHGRPEQVWMDLEYTPVADADGRPLGVLAMVFDTTDRVRAERRLAESEARYRFLDEVGQAVIPIHDADKALDVTCAMIAAHFGVTNCSYADMDADALGFTIRGGWNADGTPSLIGRHRLSDFGEAAVRELSAGRPLVLNDNREELPPGEAESYQALGVTATLCMPLVKDGRLRALMAVHDKAARRWREDEVVLMQALVERSWAHVERVGAEANLRAREEQLRLSIDAGEIALWDVDMLTGALYWPARLKAMFGMPSDAHVTLEDFYAGLHPDDLQPTSQAYAASFDPERRALYDVEYRTVGKADGVVRWVAAKGRGVFEDGRCVRTIGTAIDITARKATEAALRELNETLERRVAEALAERRLLADLVENTDAIIQVVDNDHRLLAVNRAAGDAFERVYGVRPRVGDRLFDLLEGRPEHQAQVREAWDRALNGEEYTLTATFGDPANDRRCYEAKFSRMLDEAGRQVGAYQIVYDVTERVEEQRRLEEAETQLRQAQKVEALGQLTGGVAHDFNNLLTPILGSLDMLSRKGFGGERERRLIDGALQSAERAKTLVQRLLAFARRQPLQPTAIDVGEILGGMAELIGSTSGPQIQVVTEIAPGLPAAHGDANQLEMALLNLSVNARDAMPDGGTLRISADARSSTGPEPRAGDYVRISVADTGVGMSTETLARAIEPFFSTKGIGKGTGLGLSMVHGLAEQLGGTLRIFSKPGLGTNAELWLPISPDQPGERVAPRAEAGSAPKGARLILLVDDEEVVRASTAHMLEEIGFRVQEAVSAEQALARLDTGVRPDLLVTDHLMPGMDGTQLVYAARERLPGLPCLIVSGYADLAGVAPEIKRLGKPFRRDELQAALTEILVAGVDAAPA